MRNFGLMIVSLAFLAVAGFAEEGHKVPAGHPGQPASPTASDDSKKAAQPPTDSMAEGNKKKDDGKKKKK